MAQIIVTIEKIQKQGVRSWTPTSSISMAIDVGDHYDITPNGTGSTIFNTLTSTEYTTTNSASSVATLIERANRSDDYMKRVAAGEVTGQSVLIKFGSNVSSADGVTEEIWDGSAAYTWPSITVPAITKISQTANQVAMLGGTIEVQGLAAGFILTTQTKTLDASDTTTPVTLNTPLIRIFRMKVQEDVVTTSPIRAHDDAEATDYAIISTGKNQTLMAIYTVPAGKTFYMHNYSASYVRDSVKDPDSINFELWMAHREDGYEFQIKHSKGIPKQASGFQHNFKPYFKVEEKHDICVTSTADGQAAYTHGGFEGILVDD
jgi:hypothetical protein